MRLFQRIRSRLDRHATRNILVGQIHTARVTQTTARAEVRVLAIDTRAQHAVVIGDGRAGLLKRGIGELGVKVGDGFVRVDDRLEGRSDLFTVEEIPVNVAKERVFLEFGSAVAGTQTVLRVAIEQLHVSLDFCHQPWSWVDLHP